MGNWYGNMKHGLGKFTLANGASYSGFYRKDV